MSYLTLVEMVLKRNNAHITKKKKLFPIFSLVTDSKFTYPKLKRIFI